MRAYHADVAEPPKDSRERKARDVLAATLMSEEQIDRWFRAPNRCLAGARPAQLLVDGGESRVSEAAEAFVDGDPL